MAGLFYSLYKFIDRVSLRSFVSLIVHVCIAVGLAALFYLGEFVEETIGDNSLVAVMASIVAVSGVFLALTLAFGTFESQFQTDWTCRNYERLRGEREKIRDMMRKSAGKYRDISIYLKDKYFFIVSYLPGKPINIDKMGKSDIKFRSWVDEEVKKSGKKIDWGNIDDYESFEKYAVDAMLVGDESREVFAETEMARLHGMTLGTLPPMIMTWALIMVFSLVFAVTGSLGVMYDRMSLSILVIPIYLSIFAVIGLVIDFRALMQRMRIREEGWERSNEVRRIPHWSEKYR